MKTNAPTALVLAAALALSACGSGSASTSRDSGGSDSGGRDVIQTEVRDPSADDGTSRTFTPETNAFMQNGLRQFGKGDPAWEKTRTQWLSMGAREQRFLVSAMFAALIKAQRMGAADLVQRARHELVLIGTPSVSFMAGVLATGTVDTIYDKIAEEEKAIKVDDDVRREAAEILALIGAPAAAATVDAVDRAETKSGRRFALQALGNMGDRGGAQAAEGLVRWAQSDDWVLRVEAVTGMRHFSDARTRQSLERSLSDDESLVREKAAESLAARREKAALGSLRAAQSRARNAGKLVESKRLERIIAIIEKSQ